MMQTQAMDVISALVKENETLRGRELRLSPPIPNTFATPLREQSLYKKTCDLFMELDKMLEFLQQERASVAVQDQLTGRYFLGSFFRMRVELQGTPGKYQWVHPLVSVNPKCLDSLHEVLKATRELLDNVDVCYDFGCDESDFGPDADFDDVEAVGVDEVPDYSVAPRDDSLDVAEFDEYEGWECE